MKKLLSILLCMVLLIVPMTFTANAQTNSGEICVAGDEPYIVDIGVGHYAYSTYTVTVPVFVMTNQPNQIIADMSNFDPNYALSCYVTNADGNRITLYADNYSTTGNAISVQLMVGNTVMDSSSQLLTKFHSTMTDEYKETMCQFDIGTPVSLNSDRVVAGNYTGTLSLKFVCEVA